MLAEKKLAKQVKKLIRYAFHCCFLCELIPFTTYRTLHGTGDRSLNESHEFYFNSYIFLFFIFPYIECEACAFTFLYANRMSIWSILSNYPINRSFLPNSISFGISFHMALACCKKTSNCTIRPHCQFNILTWKRCRKLRKNIVIFPKTSKNTYKCWMFCGFFLLFYSAD